MSVDTVTIEEDSDWEEFKKSMQELKNLKPLKRRSPLAKQWRSNYEWRKKPVIRLIMADAQLQKNNHNSNK